MHMADTISPERRSANMSRIRSRDTKPEMIVRRMLHAMGYRYRLQARGMPGRPDIVFRRRRSVIFVHGCFWHQHAECGAGRRPKSNDGYWSKKLARNVERDARTEAQLTAEGWRVLIVWECQMKDQDALRERLAEFLGSPSLQP